MRWSVFAAAASVLAELPVIAAPPCVPDEAASCTRDAKLLDEKGLRRNDFVVGAMFDRACELGSAEACERYAEMVVAKRRVPHNRTSIDAYSLACDRGRASACFGLGTVLLGRDSAVAYRRACEGGYGPACVEIKRRIGDPAALRKGCDRGEGETCLRLARAIEEGLVAARDAGEVIRLQDLACAENVGDACAELASSARRQGEYWYDSTIFSSVLSFTLRGCRAGDSKACAKLEELPLVWLLYEFDQAGPAPDVAREVIEQLDRRVHHAKVEASRAVALMWAGDDARDALAAANAAAVKDDHAMRALITFGLAVVEKRAARDDTKQIADFIAAAAKVQDTAQSFELDGDTHGLDLTLQRVRPE